MLRTFRNASNSLFIKILFTAIILSFCLWGIGDIIRNYSASQPVITVNKTSVTSESFSREYNQTRQNIRNAGERGLTDAEMKSIDVKGLVLEQMIDKAVLEETMKKYGIVIPKKTVLRVIESIPEFQKDGVFDGRLYTVLLQRSGMSESAFVNNIKENLSKNQILNPLIAGYRVPSFIKETIAKEFDSKKTLAIGYVKLADMKIDAVDEEDISEYYNSHKDQYKKSETRDVSILIVDSSKLVGQAEITQEEINEYYNANQEAFAPKEVRSFERLTFKTSEDANKAWGKMNKGAQTAEIMKNFLPQVEKLDDMERHAFPKEIGDALFATLKKKQDVSEVYNIGGQYYIYRLTNISILDQKSRADIDKEIKVIIQNEKSNTPEFYQKVKELRNKIDDGFGSGKNVEDMAKETGMEIVTVSGIKKGDPLQIANLNLDKATIDDLNEAIFTTDEGQASSTIDSHEVDTLSFVVCVKKVNKESVPELTVIKETVKADCAKDRQNEAAKDIVTDITDSGDKAITSVGTLKNVQLITISKKDILMDPKMETKKVSSLAKIIPNMNVVMDVLSNLKKGEAKYFIMPNGDYMLVAMKDVVQADSVDARFSNTISAYIDNASKKDMSLIAVKAFKAQSKIKINEGILNEITKSVDDEDAKE